MSRRRAKSLTKIWVTLAVIAVVLGSSFYVSEHPNTAPQFNVCLAALFCVLLLWIGITLDN